MPRPGGAILSRRVQSRVPLVHRRMQRQDTARHCPRSRSVSGVTTRPCGADPGDFRGRRRIGIDHGPPYDHAELAAHQPDGSRGRFIGLIADTSVCPGVVAPMKTEPPHPLGCAAIHDFSFALVPIGRRITGHWPLVQLGVKQQGLSARRIWSSRGDQPRCSVATASQRGDRWQTRGTADRIPQPDRRPYARNARTCLPRRCKRKIAAG